MSWDFFSTPPFFCLSCTDDDSSESDDENLEDVVVTGMESRLREINKSVQKFEYKTHISRKQVIEVEEAADLE